MYDPEALVVDRELYRNLIKTVLYKLNEIVEDGAYPLIAIMLLDSYIERYDYGEEAEKEEA